MSANVEKKMRQLHLVSEGRYNSPVVDLGDISLPVNDAEPGQDQIYQVYSPTNLASGSSIVEKLLSCPCASTLIE